jgi:hypothetical protein
MKQNLTLMILISDALLLVSCDSPADPVVKDPTRPRT